MKFHPCLFTFFCQLRIRKIVPVNLICSETFSDFPQYVRNFLHCLLSRHKNTSKKKELILQWKSPQQVHPSQNVLNPSLLIRLSKYLPKVTPKEFEGKRKGKSGKDETSLFGSKFFFGGGKKWGEKQKKERSLSAVNSIFSPRKKNQSEGQKKSKEVFRR